jgi:glycosyltransferase involved in cell wall biosynthesis
MTEAPLIRLNQLPIGDRRKGEGGLRLSGALKTSTSDLPLVTIITAVYNGEEYLEETIQRVLAQTYPNLEYVIVDGGSKDQTLEIIKKYEAKIDYWVSESDKGIGDAFNRGVLLSRGTYLNFQGDGDGFVDKDAISSMMKAVQGKTPPFIATRIERVDIKGKHLYNSPKISANKHTFLFKMGFPHQGLFTHINMFEKFGLFDVNNTYCMDYEHLLRAYSTLPDTFVWNHVTAQWRADGLGNGKTLDILKEYDVIKRKHQLAPPSVLYMIDRWSHLKFFIKELIGKK